MVCWSQRQKQRCNNFPSDPGNQKLAFLCRQKFVVSWSYFRCFGHQVPLRVSCDSHVHYEWTNFDWVCLLQWSPNPIIFFISVLLCVANPLSASKKDLTRILEFDLPRRIGSSVEFDETDIKNGTRLPVQDIVQFPRNLFPWTENESKSLNAIFWTSM